MWPSHVAVCQLPPQGLSGPLCARHGHLSSHRQAPDHLATFFSHPAQTWVSWDSAGHFCTGDGASLALTHLSVPGGPGSSHPPLAAAAFFAAELASEAGGKATAKAGALPSQEASEAPAGPMWVQVPKAESA